MGSWTDELHVLKKSLSVRYFRCILVQFLQRIITCLLNEIIKFFLSVRKIKVVICRSYIFLSQIGCLHLVCLPVMNMVKNPEEFNSNVIHEMGSGK